ncbi:MAG: DUF3857 domain-containing protein [Bacteroidota bacterium]
MKRYHLLTLLLVSFSTSFFAQDLPDIKFGKIADGDIAMTSLAIDTSAEAYMLYEEVSHYIVDERDGYKLGSYYHRRVKLLKPESFDRANIELTYTRQEEKIRNLNAMIILPSGESIKLRSKDFIKDDLSDDQATIRFTFPQVVEGAILEYRYQRISENISQIPTHYFQRDIPVRRSKFEAEMNSLFSYRAICNAFDMLCVKQENQIRGTEPANHANGVSAVKYKYEMCNVPAFNTEPYVNNFTDYLPHVYLQLDSYYNNTTGWSKYLSTWETTARELCDNDYIGKRFMRSNSGRKIAEAIGPLMGSNEQEKAQYALNAINNHMEWNGYYNFGTQESLNSLWDKGVAGSGALNMMLYTLLEANDIKVEPALTGLRNYGRPIMEFPVLRQFQHLMVLATLDGKPYLLDANGHASIVGLPRVAALNEAAWVFDKTKPHWISVKSPVVTNVYQIEGQVHADGMAELSVKNQAKQYYALYATADLADENDEVEGPIIDQLLEKFPDTEMTERQYDPWIDPTQAFELDVDAKAPIGQTIDDYIYLQPILFDALQDDLVEDELRMFPIDFAYPFRQVFLATYELPEGYIVDEMPEAIRMRSPEGDIRVQMVMQYKEAEHKLEINYSVSVTESLFAADQYENLREIFQRVVDVQESVVVLKKM